MNRFNAYDVDRACDLVEGFRDTLNGESRRLVNLALDLVPAGAEGGFQGPGHTSVRGRPGAGRRGGVTGAAQRGA